MGWKRRRLNPSPSSETNVAGMIVYTGCTPSRTLPRMSTRATVSLAKTTPSTTNYTSSCWRRPFGVRQGWVNLELNFLTTQYG